MSEIETLKSLAWTPYPKPPLGIPHWERRRRWFRWFVTYQFEWLIWKVRVWLWYRRTKGGQATF